MTHKTIRCQPKAPEDIFSLAREHGIPFPLLVRLTKKNDGITLTKLLGPKDIDKLEALPFDGSPMCQDSCRL